MKYQVVDICADKLPVNEVCGYLGVARSSYYKWRQVRPGKRETEDGRLEAILAAEFEKHLKAYGTGRLRARLRRLGHHHGRRRISRLMKQRGLSTRKKRRFVVTTVADPSKRAAPNGMVPKKWTQR